MGFMMPTAGTRCRPTPVALTLAAPQRVATPIAAEVEIAVNDGGTGWND
jgi:hypothetical protein